MGAEEIHQLNPGGPDNIRSMTLYQGHLHSCDLVSGLMVPLGKLSKKKLRKIAIIFLSVSLNMCFGCSKEPSH